MKLTPEQIREAWDTWQRVIDEMYHPLEMSSVGVVMDRQTFEVGFGITLHPYHGGDPGPDFDDDAGFEQWVRNNPNFFDDKPLIYPPPYLAVVKGLKGEEGLDALLAYVDAHPELFHHPSTVLITHQMVERSIEGGKGLFTVEELLAGRPKVN